MVCLNRGYAVQVVAAVAGGTYAPRKINAAKRRSAFQPFCPARVTCGVAAVRGSLFGLCSATEVWLVVPDVVISLV